MLGRWAPLTDLKTTGTYWKVIRDEQSALEKSNKVFFFLPISLLLLLFYFTILYWFCHTSTWIRHERTRVPHPEHPSHFRPIPSLQVIPVHQPQASCIKPGLVIRFLYDIIHVSMTFPQIIPPSPSFTESKRLFYTSVSLLLSCKESYHYIFLNSIYMILLPVTVWRQPIENYVGIWLAY